MAGYITNQQPNTGNYVQQTPVFDVSRIYQTDVNSTEFKELIVKLTQEVNNHAICLNNKISGMYLTEEFVSGKLLFNPNSSSQLDLRACFIEVVNVGPLGPGITPANHGLTVTNTWKWLFIGGAATNTNTLVGYPITFGGAANNNIGVNVTNTQVIVNNNSGVTFTDSYVVLEYVKN
jgi:hypothetical protein